MNPSTQELLQAVEAQAQRCNSPAQQWQCPTGRSESQGTVAKNVVVVPSDSIPQGISALLAFNYQADLEKNARAMEKATQNIQTAEITRAIRSVKINGLEVEEGEIIGLLNGDLTASGSTTEEVVFEMLDQMKASEYEIITVYYGEDVTQSQAEDLVRKVQERYSEQELELINGGQPHYYYIISAE